MFFRKRAAVVSKSRPVHIRKTAIRQINSDVNVRFTLSCCVESRLRCFEYRLIQLLLRGNDLVVDRSDLCVRNRNFDSTGLSVKGQTVAAEPGEHVIDENRETHVDG